jgi:hypothetical protein
LACWLASGEEITFEPTLALVLTQHRIEYPSGGRKKFVILDSSGVPLPVGHFENRAQEIGNCLIRTEDAEIALILIQLGHVSQEVAKNERILAVDRAWREHVDRMGAEIRHTQIPQKNAAVGVRIGAHAAVTLRRQFGQFRHQPAIFVE